MPEVRQKNLPLVVDNPLFLILPQLKISPPCKRSPPKDGLCTPCALWWMHAVDLHRIG